MIEEAPTLIDDSSGEGATEPITQYSYDISADMRAGRTCYGIVRALAQVLGTELHELPPLYTVVECDALDQLFCPHRDDRTRPAVSVTFRYDTYIITLTADGHLTITE